MSRPVPPPYSAYPQPRRPRPPGYTEHPHPEPRSYPLILRTWDFEAWRPVVGLVCLLLAAVVVVPLLLLPVLAIGIAIQGGNFSSEFSQALQLSKLTPAAMLYLNLTLAALVLVTWAIARWLHRLRPRWLMSVRPGIRWKFFWACFGLALVAMACQLGVGSLLPGNTNGLNGHLQPFGGQVLALGLVVLITTPLQAMGEEYAFRGYTMQAIGSLVHRIACGLGVRPPRARLVAEVLAVVLSGLVFAFAHGLQNGPLFIDRFAFGLLAGYLVVRTGGLEAGIALHIWNNLVSFGFGIAFGSAQQMLTETKVSWWNLPITVTQTVVYLVLVLFVAKKMGLDNRTRPPTSTARPEAAVDW